MKIRNGFVSNSSSSSFLIIGDAEFPYENIELTLEQKQLVKSQGYDISIDDKIRLTCFVSDSLEYDFLYEKGHDYEEEFLLPNFISYKDGNHGCPYHEEDYIEISDNVWLYKGDSNEN